MRGIGQWASGPESWGPNQDPTRQKKKKMAPFPKKMLMFPQNVLNQCVITFGPPCIFCEYMFGVFLRITQFHFCCMGLRAYQACLVHILYGWRSRSGRNSLLDEGIRTTKLFSIKFKVEEWGNVLVVHFVNHLCSHPLCKEGFHL